MSHVPVLVLVCHRSCTFSHRKCDQAAVFVTNPMVRLLRIVQRLNSGAFTVDLPPLEGGSREVHRVYNTFAKLCKVVRISNTAFFSGNLKWAYHFVSDALKLFRKIGDTKAIGVASNNLGVFAHALCRESKVGPSCLIMNGECCAVKIGLRHYTEAIRIAELDFEKATDSATKAEYAQQLANRRFNRGLFLLLTSDDSCAPAKAREKGVSDILRTKDLDADVVEYWFKRKLVLKKSGAYFSILLRRVGGLTFHDDIPALRQAWRVEDLIDDADRLLHAAWNEVKSPLFQRLSHAGRLQQLEGVAIHLQMQRGETLDAARLATRMFIEDSFLLEAPFAIASKALLAATSPGGGVSLSPKALSSLHHDIRLMALSCKNVFVSIRQNVVFCFELGHTWKGDIVLDGMRQICLKIFDRRCGENDHVGIVSNAAEKGLSQALSPVSPSARKKLRETLMSAAISTGKGEALTIAVQMILDSDLTHDRDTFLIYFSDGSKVDATEFASLQRRVARFNEKADTAMHIFAAGVGIRDDKTKDVLRKICEVSKSSMYKECSRDTVDELFYDISTRMGRDRDLSGQFNKFGATLEQF